MRKQLDSLGLPFIKVNAVYGKDLPIREKYVCLERPAPKDREWLYPLNDSEIGCFLSHKNRWLMLVDSHESWALILEDDAILSKSLPGFLRCLDQLPQHVRLIQIESKEKQKI